MQGTEKLKQTADKIYRHHKDQKVVVHIDCTNFQNIPSPDDFRLESYLKISKSNAFRIALMILSLAQFTHYVSFNFIKK